MFPSARSTFTAWCATPTSKKCRRPSGNTIDPLLVTEKYGTDAIRMALLQGAAPGTDIVLTEQRMESSRAFANKIWNAARFLFMSMERSGVEPWLPRDLEAFQPEPDLATMAPPLEDRWIFSRLNHCADQVNRAIESPPVSRSRPAVCGSSSGTNSATGISS